MRYELKYFITKGEYLALRNNLAAICTRDVHVDQNGEYTVSSIYFDSNKLDCYNDKVDGLFDYFKLRLRTYSKDMFQKDLPCKLEAKIKKGSLGHKLVFNYDDIKFLLNPSNWQKVGEVDFFFISKYLKMNLTPKCFINYQREAFEFKNDSVNVRLNFDHHITTRNISRSGEVEDRSFSDYDFIVFEIKTLNKSLPPELVHYLTPFHLERTSFSKYIWAMDKLIYKNNFKNMRH